MDAALLPAVSALAGSLIGGIATFSASWLTHHKQVRVQTHIHELAKREALYAEFISEASKRRAQAWSHHAETPEVIAGLYSGVRTDAPDVVKRGYLRR